jgi:FlgD Ig-like domain
VRRSRRKGRGAAALLAALLVARAASAQTPWGDYAGNAQHTALSRFASQPLSQIMWQTPVDLQPQYSGSDLFIHYGSPLVSALNTIVVPVKTGATDGFRVETRAGNTGVLRWSFDSDYSLPAHNWTPSFTPTLTPTGRLFIPGAGGTVLVTDGVDSAAIAPPVRVAFYGLANYNANPAAYNADLQICTPLTSDAAGNVFFGFRAGGTNPLGIVSGLARLGADGSASWVGATAATSGAASQVLMNCAPALSPDGHTVYVAMKQGYVGVLIALDAGTLSTKEMVALKDPNTGNNAALYDDGTASPMVAPDGRVFFGVLENPGLSNADRGWLLAFDGALNPAGAPGAFGWDDTPSLVPASTVASYTGTSSYLLMTKYNFYAGIGGDGVNRIAILDPNATQIDAHTGTTVMKEVMTIAGVTPDPEFVGSTYPNAVREWCINSAVVDTFTRCVLAGSEDGRLYRWDLASNSFSEVLTLTPGIGEAYTPTLIARDGRVYAINNATLFSVGVPEVLAAEAPVPRGPALDLAPPSPNPFSRAATIRFSLPKTGPATLDILDLGGRRITTLLERELSAGAHAARWDGRDHGGHDAPAGVYFVRLIVGGRMTARKLLLVR